MAAAEAKIYGDALRRLREVASQKRAAANLGVQSILAALDKLSALQVDMILQRETGIGREVNDKFLRLHADNVVRDRSRALVHSWKSLVQPKAPANVPAADTPAAESAVPDEGVAAEAEAFAITPAADKPVAEADALDDGAATEVARLSNAGTQRKRASASEDEAPRRAKAAKGAKVTPAPSPDGPNATLARCSPSSRASSSRGRRN